MKNIKAEAWVKVLIAALILFVIAVVHFLNPGFFPKMWMVVSSGNVKAVEEYLRSYEMWAVVFSFLLDVLVNALGFLPSIFISTANGVLFGVVPGIIISWLAECVGVILSFMLMRSILRDSAKKLIAKSAYMQKLDEFSGENGFKMMLVARTLPYFPSGIVTAVGALSKISFRDYALANLIGKFPSTALEVIIGHDVVNYEKNMGRLSIVVVSVVTIYLGLWLTRRKKHKH
ncbi:MAG: TVP38/TMEM64 family protein [Desulfitobacteriaceae bacterium]